MNNSRHSSAKPILRTSAT